MDFTNIPGNGNLPCFGKHSRYNCYFDIIQNFTTLNYIIPLGRIQSTHGCTHTCSKGTGNWQVQVWVQPKIPRGYLCQSLPTTVLAPIQDMMRGNHNEWLGMVRVDQGGLWGLAE